MDKISVLIVDKSQTKMGILANAAFVLGLTAGRELNDDTFGYDVIDGNGKNHKYLTQIGHYVRKAGQSKIRSLRDEFASNPDITVIDYTEAAAPADYSEYAKSLSTQKNDEIQYRALYVYGPADAVIPKTKNLSSL